MSSKAKFIGVIALGVFLASSLSACAEEPVSCKNLLASEVQPGLKTDEVALVMAPSASFAEFSGLITTSTPTIQSAMGAKGSRLAIILADGSPGVSTSYDVKGDQFDAEIAKDQAFAINRADYVYSCVADPHGLNIVDPITPEPESDLIGALRQASDSFDAKNEGSKKHIIVLANGLQTAGQFQMQSEGIPKVAEVNTIVSNLSSGGALPDLRDATVDFIGLGHVGIPAQRLNQQSVEGLEAFWTAVVEASNGHIGSIQREVGDTPPSKLAVPISEVKKQPDVCISAVVTEDDGARFTPGTANFIDQAAATASAKKIAAQLAKKADCKGTLTVTGYVASGVNKADYKFGNSGDASLSKARARAFASLLTAAGVKTSITVIGGGKGPFSDWDKSGKYVESLGKKNRIVSVSQ